MVLSFCYDACVNTDTSMNDNFFRKRLDDHFINPHWFWEHSDIDPRHLQNVKDIFHLEMHSEFQVLDTWSLHPDVTITQGVWCLQEDGVSVQMLAVCLSVLGKDATSLPYMVFSAPEDEESPWWEHTLARGWSPLKWWFANRDEDAHMFTTLCERHLTERDWHLAGVPSAVAPASVLQKLLQLARPKEKRNLHDQAINNWHHAF